MNVIELHHVSAQQGTEIISGTIGFVRLYGTMDPYQKEAYKSLNELQGLHNTRNQGTLSLRKE
jgi:hypothetical protein